MKDVDQLSDEASAVNAWNVPQGHKLVNKCAF